MKKQKVPKEPKPRKPYLEWYKARKPFKVAIKEMWLPIVSLILCIFIAEAVCEVLIGDALYLYSDDTYKYIESSVEQYTTNIPGEKAFGIETYKLQEIMDVLTLSYDKKSNTNTLVCSIRNGFFNAVVTTHLSADFTIDSDPASPSYSFEMNFTSFNDYKQFFWLVHKCVTFGGGIVLWGMLILCKNGILKLIAWNYQRKANKAEKVKENQAEVTVPKPDMHPTVQPAATFHG